MLFMMKKLKCEKMCNKYNYYLIQSFNMKCANSLSKEYCNNIENTCLELAKRQPYAFNF